MWEAAAKSAAFLPLSFTAPVVPSNATKFPETGEVGFWIYPSCVWEAAAKSAAFLPLSFCAPVVPSNATKFPETGEGTISGFPSSSAFIFPCIAVWSAAVKYRPIMSPFVHERGLVPSYPRSMARTFPTFAVMRTVSAVVVSAPIVKRLGASGKIEPSRTVTLVSEVVRDPASVVSGVFGCAGYIVFNCAIV